MRAARSGVEVHDPALKALVDEIVVAGIAARLGDRRAPDLEVDQRVFGDGGEEGLAEADGVAFERVRGLIAHEVDDGRAIGRLADGRGVGLDARVGARAGRCR